MSVMQQEEQVQVSKEMWDLLQWSSQSSWEEVDGWVSEGHPLCL